MAKLVTAASAEDYPLETDSREWCSEQNLATIDYLSSGRLRVGLGLGWSQDEMDATGADMKQRGAMANEFLEVLKAVWTQNPVEFRGKFYKLPKSYIDLKPTQKPHPPIYLAAFAPVAL